MQELGAMADLAAWKSAGTTLLAFQLVKTARELMLPRRQTETIYYQPTDHPELIASMRLWQMRSCWRLHSLRWHPCLSLVGPW